MATLEDFLFIFRTWRRAETNATNFPNPSKPSIQTAIEYSRGDCRAIRDASNLSKSKSKTCKFAKGAREFMCKTDVSTNTTRLQRRRRDREIRQDMEKGMRGVATREEKVSSICETGSKSQSRFVVIATKDEVAYNTRNQLEDHASLRVVQS